MLQSMKRYVTSDMSWEEREGRLWEAGVCCPCAGQEVDPEAPGLDHVLCAEWVLWRVGAGPHLPCRTGALERGRWTASSV